MTHSNNLSKENKSYACQWRSYRISHTKCIVSLGLILMFAPTMINGYTGAYLPPTPPTPEFGLPPVGYTSTPESNEAQMAYLKQTDRAPVNPSFTKPSIVQQATPIPVDTPGGIIPGHSNSQIVLKKNSDTVMRLLAQVPIPDGGEMNFPIVVPDNLIIKSIQVKIRGLSHPDPEDLTVSVQHRGRSVKLFDRRLGRRDVRGQSKVRFGAKEGVNPLKAMDYVFSDKDYGLNIAQGKSASQSSTNPTFGASANLAVDGNTDGFLSNGSTTLTGPANNDPKPWWQVDLAVDRPVGTVRIWSRQIENSIDEIIVVRLTAEAAIPLSSNYSDRKYTVSGGFHLTYTINGAVYTTPRIAYNAVAMRKDENRAIADPGIGRGESMQAILEQMPEAQTVSVSRNNYLTNGYEWRITFNNAQVLSSSINGGMPVLTVGTTDLGHPSAAIQIETLRDASSRPGFDSPDFDVDFGSDVTRAYNAARYKGVEPLGKYSNLNNGFANAYPFWLLLFSESSGPPPAGSSLDQAKSLAIWKRRIVDDGSGNLLKGNIGRETVLTFAPVTARYLRIMVDHKPILPTGSVLCLSEVQVYAKEMKSLLLNYRAGSPVNPGDYTPEESFDEAFKGLQAMGMWTLRIRDNITESIVGKSNLPPEEITQAGIVSSRDSNGREQIGMLSGRPSSRPEGVINGKGHLDDWQLLITDSNDVEHVFYSELRVEIVSLPVWGSLYSIGVWNPQEVTITIPAANSGTFNEGDIVSQPLSGAFGVVRTTVIPPNTNIIVTVTKGTFTSDRVNIGNVTNLGLMNVPTQTTEANLTIAPEITITLTDTGTFSAGTLVSQVALSQATLAPSGTVKSTVTNGSDLEVVVTQGIFRAGSASIGSVAVTITATPLVSQRVFAKEATVQQTVGLNIAQATVKKTITTSSGALSESITGTGDLLITTMTSGTFAAGAATINNIAVTLLGQPATSTAGYERGQKFLAKSDQKVPYQQCYGNCEWKFGHGAKLNQYMEQNDVAKTRDSPDATDMNFMNGERMVIYAPNSNYVGDDSFTFRVYFALDQAPKLSKIRMNIRDCRRSTSIHTNARPSTWLSNGGSGILHCQNDVVSNFQRYNWEGRRTSGGGENSLGLGIADDSPGVPANPPLPSDRTRPRTGGFNEGSNVPNFVTNEETFYNPKNLLNLGKNPGTF